MLIVGHQPALGRVAALLLAGVEQDWVIRKSSVVWIARKTFEGFSRNYLKAAIGPDLVCN